MRREGGGEAGGQSEGGERNRKRTTAINKNFKRSARISWIGVRPPSLARGARQVAPPGGPSADPRNPRGPPKVFDAYGAFSS